MRKVTYVLYINGELSGNDEDEFVALTDAVVACTECIAYDPDIETVEIRKRVIEDEVLYTHARGPRCF